MRSEKIELSGGRLDGQVLEIPAGNLELIVPYLASTGIGAESPEPAFPRFVRLVWTRTDRRTASGYVIFKYVGPKLGMA